MLSLATRNMSMYERHFCLQMVKSKDAPISTLVTDIRLIPGKIQVTLLENLPNVRSVLVP